MFYNFRQNNSGGSFNFDASRGISVNVIVEASSPERADAIAETIGLYFDGCETGDDCDCCGDRWSRTWGEGTAVPSVYGDPIVDGTLRGVDSFGMKWMDGPEGYIHYADGRVEPFDLGAEVKRRNKKR